MPALDEDILSDLMHRATTDLHAQPAVAAGIAAHRRRTTFRIRALGVSAAGVAAATAIGLAATAATSGGTAGTAHRPVALPKLKLTAAQRELNHLSLTAAMTRADGLGGRYVVMAELQGKDKRTTIIDGKTGDVWTFQSGAGIPDTLPVYRHGSPTEAEVAAYPTDLAGLRALLARQARHDLAVGIKDELAAIKIKDPGNYRQVKRTMLASVPKETRNDLVFSQAAYLLWNPLVTPTLRSALFKVLAATPGVVVSTQARDNIGRPAVEISRFDKAANYTQAIFESPDASRVLETDSIHPATPAKDGLPADAAYDLPDTYLSITRTDTRPAKDPYRK